MRTLPGHVTPLIVSVIGGGEYPVQQAKQVMHEMLTWLTKRFDRKIILVCGGYGGAMEGALQAAIQCKRQGNPVEGYGITLQGIPSQDKVRGATYQSTDFTDRLTRLTTGYGETLEPDLVVAFPGGIGTALEITLCVAAMVKYRHSIQRIPGPGGLLILTSGLPDYVLPFFGPAIKIAQAGMIQGANIHFAAPDVAHTHAETLIKNHMRETEQPSPNTFKG